MDDVKKSVGDMVEEAPGQSEADVGAAEEGGDGSSGVEFDSLVVCRQDVGEGTPGPKWRHGEVFRHFSEIPEGEGVVDIKIHPEFEAAFVRFSSKSLAEEFCSLESSEYQGKELHRTLFLDEPDCLSNERLKTFLRKEPYLQSLSARHAGDRKRRLPATETNGKAVSDGGSGHTTHQKSVKPKKKKEKPYWEDY